MRILIATGIFPPDIGGPATYSAWMADEFAKRLHEVSVISFGARKKDMEGQTVPYALRTVSRTLPKGIRHMVYFWNVLRAGARAEIIYAQDAVSAGFPAVLAAWMLRKRFFLKVVGDHAWEQGRQRFCVADLLDDFLTKKYGMRIALLRFFQTCAARYAEKIIVPSVYLQSVVERWGISPERIVVIPNAVSLPDAIPAKEEAREVLGKAGFLLVTIGRLVPWKGFAMLVELMPELIKNIPDAKLVIIGDGPERREIELRIKNHGLENNVFLTGVTSRDTVVFYLAAADVFCLNTGYEGFSHQLIEAMALGVPVITTCAGGNKELVRDGENALVAEYDDLVSWKERILELYRNESLREKFKVNNRAMAKQYSIETMVAKTENLFAAHRKLPNKN